MRTKLHFVAVLLCVAWAFSSPTLGASRFCVVQDDVAPRFKFGSKISRTQPWTVFRTKNPKDREIWVDDTPLSSSERDRNGDTIWAYLVLNTSPFEMYINAEGVECYEAPGGPKYYLPKGR